MACPGWIHVFQVAPDRLVWERDYPLDIDCSDHQEAEGITIIDTTAPGGSAGRSQIHVEVYKNADAAGDHELWSHHYAVSGAPSEIEKDNRNVVRNAMRHSARMTEPNYRSRATALPAASF